MDGLNTIPSPSLTDVRKEKTIKAKCVNYGVQYYDLDNSQAEQKSMLKESDRKRKK